MQYFEYGETELNYLRRKDKRLGQAIDRIGLIKRQVEPDVFSALMSSIVAQQISAKAAQTIWDRLCSRFGGITPAALAQAPAQELQSTGITMRKAKYMKDIAEAVSDGRFKIDELSALTDEAVAARLSALNGVGVWTAEMLMIFSLQRKDIVSRNDLGIRKGMMALYHHQKLDNDRFERIRKRYSPYGTVASFYLWEIAMGR